MLAYCSKDWVLFSERNNWFLRVFAFLLVHFSFLFRRLSYCCGLLFKNFFTVVMFIDVK